MDKRILQGWECPKCGAVMSPTTSVCVNCNGHIEVSVNTNSIMSDPYIGLTPEIKKELMKMEGKPYNG